MRYKVILQKHVLRKLELNIKPYLVNIILADDALAMQELKLKYYMIFILRLMSINLINIRKEIKILTTN